jgi:NTP pyrophosphatase (non-canonical NTP hydrolase)
MTLNEYQTAAATTALGLATETLWYPALGLAGEAGEVAEKIKKYYRDGHQLDRDLIVKELGDVLWYLSALASGLDIELDEVAEMNIEKLASRKERNVLHGEGDNR